ncbi:MAG: flavin reductase family protein [Succinivibrio sp.]
MEISSFKTDIFNIFDKRWALVTASDGERVNGMTISWGTMGTIWGKATQGLPIVTVFINPKRYTFGILQRAERFTVSFFTEEHRHALSLMGRRSGRDGDKLKGTGLELMQDGDYFTYRQAELSFECRKIFVQQLERSLVPEELASQFYAPGDKAHCMFIGQVEKILEGPSRS